MAPCLIDLSTITEETLPLILVLISIILFGNIIRLIYFADKNKINKQSRLKIKDTIVITSGLLINWVTLQFMKLNYSIESFKAYIDPKTWLYLSITTLVVGFFTWEFRNKGKKYLKDTISDLFSTVLGVFFIIIVIVFIGNIISFLKLLSLDNLTELITNIMILFSVALVLFFGYAAKKLLNIKERRYPRRKKK